MSHYSPEFINAQKESLIKERDRLKEDLKNVATYDEEQGRYMPKFEEFNAGDVEDNAEAEDEETVFGENTAVMEGLVKSLDEVETALKDIDAEKYGYCENCGEYISEERLKAYPAAKTCINCE